MKSITLLTLLLYLFCLDVSAQGKMPWDGQTLLEQSTPSRSIMAVSLGAGYSAADFQKMQASILAQRSAHRLLVQGFDNARNEYLIFSSHKTLDAIPQKDLDEAAEQIRTAFPQAVVQVRRQVIEVNSTPLVNRQGSAKRPTPTEDRK